MQDSTALALVPLDGSEHGADGTERRKGGRKATRRDDPQSEHKAERQQVSLRQGLRSDVTAERDRIEVALPEHRRRSVEHYLDLAVRLGLRELRKVTPLVDPLADLDAE